MSEEKPTPPESVATGEEVPTLNRPSKQQTLPLIQNKGRNRFPAGFKRLLIFKGHKEQINQVAWSSNGRYLASAGYDGTLIWWDTENQILLYSRSVEEAEKPLGSIFSVAWSPDDQMIAYSYSLHGRGHIEVFNIQTLNKIWGLEFEEYAGEVSWSADGRIIYSGSQDKMVHLYNSQTGESLAELARHQAPVPTVVCSPGGQVLASGDMNGVISLWDTKTLKFLRELEGHSSTVWSIAWSPTQNILASGSGDKTLRIWDAQSGKQIHILEGHTSEIVRISFSYDGRLLASKDKNEVRFWRCDTWEEVAILKENGQIDDFIGLAFHPTRPILATLGEKNKNIRLWELDFNLLLRHRPSSQSTYYRNAKIVLVGDTGVGKSGLGLVLTGHPWTKTESTHGRRVWVLDKNEVKNNNGQIETRETLLWDLAGQPDYRLIHQLHLTDVATALVVFDSRNPTDPFAGVQHWHRALRQAQRVRGDSAPSTKKFLVAARVDVGRIGVSPARIDVLKQDFGFDEYFETSAKENWGIAELAQSIRESIEWETLPAVTSSELFQNIKSFLIAEKETGRLISPLDDLYRAFLQSPTAPPSEVDSLRAHFETCIGRLDARGLIQNLSFGSLILLQPELQDVYASAMANAVKDDPDGLGCISEQKARRGEFRIPKSERIKDREQEELLLISTIEELIRHEIALREQGEGGQLLVFPSQLTRENPDLPDPEGKAVVFNFEGPVMNIYATLAVRISYSSVFRKKEMWKNAATYTAAVGGTCGMYLREKDEGRGELTLFFDSVASEETRYQFEEFIHTHLLRRALPESVHRRRIFVCSNCDTPVADIVAKRRRERDFDSMSCPVCEVPVSLLDREERLPAIRTSKIVEMDRAADTQRERQTAASVLEGKVATGDFDVFLCHNSADKDEVKLIGAQLKQRGILPWLDEWELRPGFAWQRLLEQKIEKIKSAAVFVGRQGIGPWQQQELEAFLREFVRRECPVIPVILPSATKTPPLPVFLKGMTWVDFRRQIPSPLDHLVWGITGDRTSFK